MANWQTDLGVSDSSHLLSQPVDSIARDLLTEAGFDVTSTSELFANDDDNHQLMVYDERIYRQTDRFFFKAVPVQ